MKLRAHHIVVMLGSLLCMAGMLLPIFPGVFPSERTGFAVVAPAWLVVTFMVLPTMPPAVFTVVRSLFKIAGAAATAVLVILSVTLSPLFIALAPVSIGAWILGGLGKTIPAFVALLGMAVLLFCAVFHDDASYGMGVFAAGGIAMIVGAWVWTSYERSKRLEVEPPELPRATVV